MTYCRPVFLMLCLMLVSVAGIASTTDLPGDRSRDEKNSNKVVPCVSIATQPAAMSVVCPGAQVTATVVASGTGTPFTYQWYKGVNALNSQTTATLSLTNVQPGDTDGYSVRVTASGGSCAGVNVLSSPFNLTVTTPVTITGNPVATSVVCPGSSISVSGSASGTGPIGYQWYKHITAITGQTSPTLSLTNLQPSETDGYTLIATGSCNFVLTSVFNLTVTTPLTITSQPVATSVVCPGSTVTAAVSVTGTGPYAYEWIKGINVIGGQTSSTLSLTNVQPGDTDGYTARVTGTCNNVLSTPFNLTVTNSPDLPALTDLYNSTGGANWTNKTGWLSGCNPCGWYGVQCDVNGRVIHIELDKNNLVGTVPSSLSSVTKLNYLNLATNQLTGTIPSSLSALSSLNFLKLASNQMSGALPASLTTISGMVHLDLSDNQFTGDIPAGLGTLTSLTRLILGTNGFTGTIPASLGNLSQLKRLELNNNQLNGTIPTSLSALSALNYLILNNNGLTGTIPTGLGGLSVLKELNLGSNELTGSIPTSLGDLSSLKYLYLGTNQLSSSIPSSLSAIPGLIELDLSHNELTGSIPAGLGNMTTLDYISVYVNKLSGCFPLSLTGLCGATTKEFWKNKDLPGGGDFDAFCNNRIGADPAQIGINISGYQTVAPGTNVILTGAGGTSFTWNTGESTQEITVTPTATTVYSLTGGTPGCLGTTSITVYTAPLAVTVNIGAESVCAGSSVELSAVAGYDVPNCLGAPVSPNGGPTSGPATPTFSYTWAAPAGVTLSAVNTSTVSVTFAANLSGVQTLTVTAADAYTSITTTQDITVKGTPVVSISGNLIISNGGSTTLMAVVSGGGMPYSYAWSTGSKASSIPVNTTGPYSVTVMSSEGCPASAGVEVSEVTAPFAITAVSLVSCTPINAYRKVVSFIPYYSGLNGSPVSFSVVNEMLPTTEPSPYSLQLYLDNPTITLKAVQSGVSSSFTYNWLEACNSGAMPPPPVNNTAPRVVIPVANQTAVAGQFFGISLAGVFTDTETPNALTLTASGLPSGLNLVGTTLSGTTSTTGTALVTITATDPGSLTANTSFNLTVNSSVSEPVTVPFAIAGVQTISCSPIHAGKIDISFLPQYVGLNGQAVSFRAINEMVPTTNVGPYSLQLYVDNPVITLEAIQSNVTSNYTYNWLSACANGVTPGNLNTAPRVANAVSNKTTVVNQPFSLNLANVFTDTETPNSLVLSVSSLPSGLSLVGTTLSGTPSTTGTTTVTITATDPGSLTVSTSFMLTVNTASAGAFTITGVQTLSCVVVSAGLRTVTFTPQYAGVNGQAITFVAVNEMLPTTNSGPYTLNLYTDNPSIKLKASQAGTVGEVSYTYNWLSACTSNSRMAAEGSGGLQVRVLGNPVLGSHATVEVSGAQGQSLRVSLVNGTGQSVSEEIRSEAGLLERMEVPVGRTPGLYLLRVSIPGQAQTIKLLRP